MVAELTHIRVRAGCYVSAMPNTLTAERLWSIPRVGPAATNTDASVVVVPVTTYDLDANEGITRLHRLAESGPVPLTDAAVSATQPAVSTDGTQLAFVRSRSGVGQIHVMPLNGGEARCLTDMPLGARSPQWLPDGSGIVFLSSVYRDVPTIEGTRAHAREIADRAFSAHVTEDRMYRFWDRWLTDGEVPHLFTISLDGSELVDLTPTWATWWSFDNVGDPGLDFDIDPSGAMVAFAAVKPAEPDAQPVWGVFTVETNGSGDPQLISGDHPGDANRPRFSPDGSTIVYGRRYRTDFYADRVRVTAFDRTAGTTNEWFPSWDRSPDGWAFDPAGTLWLTAEDAGGSKVFVGGPSDDVPTPRTEGGTVGGLTVAGNRPVFLRQSLTAPAELHDLDGPLTSFADMADIQLGAVHDLTFAGADGADVQMFVIEPPDFDEGEAWPLVHLIHGGPHGVFGDTWHWRWNAHVVASGGYVVTMVNFHGSSSWGQDFGESILGEWGDKPYRDVMAATDLLAARPSIDETRMAVTGGSYGGYLTAWITSQTDRFRCAIAHAAVTNLGGMYASDVVFHRATAFGAEYWDDRERVERWSPSAHAAGYSTPTLVIHGEQDYRVPLNQGIEYYGILKSKGVEARLVYYPDENHWILTPQNSIHWYGEFLGWLDRHLAA